MRLRHIAIVGVVVSLRAGGLGADAYIDPLEIGSGDDVFVDRPPDFANPALSPYQRELLKLRWDFHTLQARALKTPLDPKDELERTTLVGRLYLRDPYWRLYNEVFQDLTALEPHEKDAERSLRAIMGALSDIRSLFSVLHRLPATKEEADTETAQLRVYVLTRDVASVQKLLTAKSK